MMSEKKKNKTLGQMPFLIIILLSVCLVFYCLEYEMIVMKEPLNYSEWSMFMI